MLSEQDFRLKADHALEALQRALLPVADTEGFEVELQNGVLQVIFEEPSPAKFVVSPNAPVRQIWLSAMSRSYKLAWSDERSAFVLDGESLDDLVLRLTRAFLAEPAVIVLDEATGSLDPATERRVVAGLASWMRGRTTILITHRLDVARRADRVVVLQRGRIVEDGPVGDLLDRGGAFTGLFAEPQPVA